MENDFHEYRARLTWDGDASVGTSSYEAYSRQYRVSFAGKPDLTASADPHFRGDKSLHNPEELLLAAISGCHMLSYLALCARSRIRVLEYADTATAVMRLDRGGGRFEHALLQPEVLVADATMVDRARRLHETAHRQCFIASSCNFEIECRPTIRTR